MTVGSAPSDSACDRRSQRVLMIACAFPPTGGPGVQRSVKFTKYLSRFGWRPTVWAADRLPGLPLDASLAADVPPDVTVHRRRHGRGLLGFRDAFRRLAAGHGSAGHLAKAIEWRLAVRNARTPVPDEYVSWALSGEASLGRLIRRERIDALYSTFSPASNHLAAMMQKTRTGLPWVADFRDLWTDDYRYREPSPERQAAHRRLQQAVLETADVVVGVSDRQTAILADHVPDLRPKFVTITNGFDPDDFDASPDGRPQRDGRGGAEGRFVLAHVGRFDHWRAGDAWFAGLERFVAGLGAGRDRFLLRIMGHADSAMQSRLRATGACCAFEGYVTHVEAIRVMRVADALLLSVPSGPNADSVIPAKLFEYLAAHRPVLVVGPVGGESDKIVQACGAGLTVGFDAEAIAAALTVLYTGWSAGRPLPGCRAVHVQGYSRIAQTRCLADILDGLVAQRRSQPEEVCTS